MPLSSSVLRRFADSLARADSYRGLGRPLFFARLHNSRSPSPQRQSSRIISVRSRLGDREYPHRRWPQPSYRASSIGCGPIESLRRPEGAYRSLCRNRAPPVDRQSLAGRAPKHRQSDAYMLRPGAQSLGIFASVALPRFGLVRYWSMADWWKMGAIRRQNHAGDAKGRLGVGALSRSSRNRGQLLRSRRANFFYEENTKFLELAPKIAT